MNKVTYLSLPKIVKPCGSCRFHRRHRKEAYLDGCEAVGEYISVARDGECNKGQLWEPQLPGFWERIGDIIIERLTRTEPDKEITKLMEEG